MLPLTTFDRWYRPEQLTEAEVDLCNTVSMRYEHSLFRAFQAVDIPAARLMMKAGYSIETEASCGTKVFFWGISL